MRIVSLQLGSDHIEFNYSLLGKETLKVNGQVVSSKFSFLGTDHPFTIRENNSEINYTLLSSVTLSGMTADIKKGQHSSKWTSLESQIGAVLIILLLLRFIF